jgi:hypothetical protein
MGPADPDPEANGRCADAQGTVVLSSERLEYEIGCSSGYDHCNVEFQIGLLNCTAGPVGIHKVLVTFVDRDGVRTERSARDYGGKKQIAPGEIWPHREDMRDGGAYEYTVTAHSPDGTVHTGTQTFTATNATLDQGIADCVACGGHWGPHGRSLTTGCLCGTPDAGKRCTDGDHCAGVCFYDPNAKPMPDEPADLLVGECSSLEVTFGCYDYIPSGASTQAPTDGAARKPSRICVD